MVPMKGTIAIQQVMQQRMQTMSTLRTVGSDDNQQAEQKVRDEDAQRMADEQTRNGQERRTEAHRLFEGERYRELRTR